MDPTLKEKIESRRLTIDIEGKPTAAEFQYILAGTADESVASTLAFDSTAAAYGDLVRRSLTLDPIYVDTTRPDSCLWEVHVSYGPPDDVSQPDEPQISFDTTGGTQHITQSKLTRIKQAGSNPDDPGIIDNEGAIGVSDSGGTLTVEGVDITVPVYSWTETRVMPNDKVNQSAIYSLTGTTNNAPWRTYARGEVLFLGATGQRKDKGRWEVTYKFAASPNKTNILIPGTSITVSDKRGWEYLWVRYVDSPSKDKKALSKKAICAYVEQVYEEGAFGTLNIGA